ncbi:hypothetical protein B0H10DRAFT_1950305 [Mycena sp. CBHHK59/15]|nr:hypothetical protein B0H10DRAFT_1950305 [Mycena sp. CBHHK59/15]
MASVMASHYPATLPPTTTDIMATLMPNFPTHLVVKEALARPVSSSDKLGKTYLMEADGEDTKYGQTNNIFRHRGEWAKQCPGQVQVWRQCCNEITRWKPKRQKQHQMEGEKPCHIVTP